MPRRPRSFEDAAAAAAVAAAEQASDVFMDRALEFAERLFSGANRNVKSALPAEYLGRQFTCAACRGQFAVDEMEMVHPTNGYGSCKQCFGFMWESAEARMRAALQAKAKAAAEQAARRAASGAGPFSGGNPFGGGNAGQQRPGGSGPQPSGSTRRKPWEVLGVDRDASVEQIKKAYRHAVLECHPDMIPPGAPSEEKERARARFEELTRAKDAMLSVRAAAS
jgi:DnaJ-domain-containing protein 1